MEQMSQVGFNKNNSHQITIPTQITVIIITGEIITREDHLMEIKELNHLHNQGQRHSEEPENQWRLIEGEHSATFVGNSVICKRIVEGNWGYVSNVGKQDTKQGIV